MIKIQEMFYQNPRDSRILEACMTSWFKNPKDLNLTSPNMKYPFNFQKWLTTFYNRDGIRTWVAKSGDWIVGHLSVSDHKDRLHIFHVIVDKDHRKKGVGESLVVHAIKEGRSKGHKRFTLRVHKKNSAAITLYEKLGFVVSGSRESNYEMELT